MDNRKIILSKGGFLSRCTVTKTSKIWSLKVDTYKVDPVCNSLKLLHNCVESFNIAQTHALLFVNELSRNQFIISEYNVTDSKVRVIHVCNINVKQTETKSALTIRSIGICQKIICKFDASQFYGIESNILGVVSGADFYLVDISEELLKVVASVAIPEESSIIWESSNIVGKGSLKCNIQFILLQRNISKVTELLGVVLEIHKSKTSLKLYDTSLFIPRLYASVTAAICVNVKNKYTLEDSQWASYFESSSVVIATTKGQLVKFYDGKLSHMCHVPCSAVKKITSMINSLGDEYLVVHGSFNHLYIFNETLEMVLQLNDIAAHFVEDFMLCGSQQLLSLQHLTSETMTFQLTDLAAHCVTNANQCADKQASENDAQSLNMVSRALRKRLQNCVGELQKADTVSRRREAMIQSTITNVQEICDEGNSSVHLRRFNGLVPLVGEASATGVYKNEFPKHKLTTGEIWQRTVRNNWVVGLTICNKDFRSMRNMTLSLVPEDPTKLTSSISTCTTSYFSHGTPTQETFEGPPHKKLHLFLCGDSDSEPDIHTNRLVESLPSGTTVDVLVTTELPLFSQCSERFYTVSLNWCYCSCKSVSLCDGNCGDLSTGIHAVRTVGRVGINVTDVMNEKHKVCLAPGIGVLTGLQLKRNLLSLNAIQQAVDLQLRSISSNLISISEVLESHLSCRFQESYKQYIVIDTGALNMVRVKLTSSCENAAKLTLFAIDQLQLVLFLHALYDAVADDVSMEIDPDTESDMKVREALSALTQEISASKRVMKNIVQKQEEQLKASFQGSLSVKNKDEQTQVKGSEVDYKTQSEFGCNEELEHFMKSKLVLETKSNRAVHRVIKLY